MKSIPLTKGMTALVDDADFDKVNKYKWYVNQHCYAIRVEKGRIIHMHRFIAGNQPGKVVDHINGNTVDNRRENLRICTNKENLRNQKIHTNNTTGYKGVSRFDAKHYQVKIRVNGKLLHIGLFKDLTEAARAYDEAAKKYHGKFARLNFGGPK